MEHGASIIITSRGITVPHSNSFVFVGRAAIFIAFRQMDCSKVLIKFKATHSSSICTLPALHRCFPRSRSINKLHSMERARSLPDIERSCEYSLKSPDPPGHPRLFSKVPGIRGGVIIQSNPWCYETPLYVRVTHRPVNVSAPVGDDASRVAARCLIM